jgi:predicted RNase H-like HicB family nuclease
MENVDILWSELFGDDDGNPDFDRARRYEPPWFGFVPRVLGVDVGRAYRPAFALWRAGSIVEAGTFTVDRRKTPGRVKPLLSLTETFADFSRERNLFGAYLATYDPGDDAARAAVAAALIREGDWCGMFVLEPAAITRGASIERAARLAEGTAEELVRGVVEPPELVARRVRLPKAPASDLALEGALVPPAEGGREAEEDELDEAGAAPKADARGVRDDEEGAAAAAVAGVPERGGDGGAHSE